MLAYNFYTSTFQVIFIPFIHLLNLHSLHFSVETKGYYTIIIIKRFSSNVSSILKSEN